MMLASVAASSASIAPLAVPAISKESAFCASAIVRNSGSLRKALGQ
jgi:hypothetical protein